MTEIHPEPDHANQGAETNEETLPPSMLSLINLQTFHLSNKQG